MFKLRNYGNTRKLPHEGEFIEISKGKTIETEDFDLALALNKYPYIDLEWPKEKKDQLKIKRQQLVRWASSLGIPDVFCANKDTLVGKITEALA